MRKLLLLTSLILLFVGIPAQAATVQYDETGRIVGALGVDVSGVRYDVLFLEGSCVSLASGCDESSDFVFQSSSQANAASWALINQVFIGGNLGPVDNTYGCDDPAYCGAVSAYWQDGTVGGSMASRQDQGGAIATGVSWFTLDSGYENLSSADYTYLTGAVWSVATVPVPAAAWLFGCGLLGLVLSSRPRPAATPV
ncbi:hypothetical protein E4634_00395 [Mangrovimicrobium sediminis]|uniref:PEP-CTERM sorting domain-containing protein n=1 Tax=Mangrovimicrobium sediminis TaxID=2562682 RepID=A0A4Z0M9J7_9GAMM|nr:hypothetical protein [Haliea sp. SAOS-164]TGD76047.1 hypothetical protein E4634_00395 [Haliea sp. SAOS-164]